MNVDVDVETALKKKRIRSNQPIENAKDKNRVIVHNMVMDQIICSLKQRFSEHGSLYADIIFILFGPPKFWREFEKMPSDAMQHISGLLRRFDNGVTKDQLQTKLLDFARKWESFKTTLEEEYSLIFDTQAQKTYDHLNL